MLTRSISGTRGIGGWMGQEWGQSWCQELEGAVGTKKSGLGWSSSLAEGGSSILLAPTSFGNTAVVLEKTPQLNLQKRNFYWTVRKGENIPRTGNSTFFRQKFTLVWGLVQPRSLYLTTGCISTLDLAVTQGFVVACMAWINCSATSPPQQILQPALNSIIGHINII